MPFDFDTPIERRASDSVKWGKYAGRDIIPLWVADMDFAVPKNPGELARQAASFLGGRAFELDAENEVYRVTCPSALQLDFAKIQGASIEEDLGRRDFTVNAMAMDLKSGKIIDPFQGQKDLEAKILRMVLTTLNILKEAGSTQKFFFRQFQESNT